MTSRGIASLLIVLALCVGFSAPAGAANEGRLVGTVVDPDGQPIDDVQIIVTGVGFDIREDRATNKKGRFTLLILDATKDYLIRLEKDGFQAIEEPLRLPLGDTMRHTWTMNPGGGVQTSGAGVSPTPEAAPSGPSSVRGQAGRLYEKGAKAYAEGDLTTAVESFEQVATLEPDVAEVHSALAMTYLRLEEWAKAASEAQRVLEIAPDELMSYEIQYDAYRALGDNENLERVLEELIVKLPGPDTARRVFNRGVAKIGAGDLEAAAADFEVAREMDPSLVAASSALSRIEFDLGRYEESIENGRQALEIDPNHYETMGVMFLALEALGRSEEAEEMFALLQEGNPEFISDVLTNLGVTYFNNGEVAKAQAIFERVLSALPDNSQAHYMLGLCYLGQGDTARAKEMLERFLELDPDHSEAATAREMLSTL